jgi:anti-sigma regulatory factor (Ser/Thr protein kinase)
MLVASELVTNAVLHSGCTERDLLQVLVKEEEGERLLIAVTDPGASPSNASISRPSGPAPGGRGLKVVEQLSERWGVQRNDEHTVWASLPTSVSDRELARGEL